MPVSRPEVTPIVATDGVPLVHDTPTGEASVTTLLVPTQIERLPATGTGVGFTITFAVLLQPADMV